MLGETEATAAAPVVQLPTPARLNHLTPVIVLDDTRASDERSQTLKLLLQKGHITVAPLREPKLILHSHLPHLLGSAYLLGASSEHMKELYEHEITTLVNIDDTFIKGNAITKKEWRNYLGQKAYTVAYVEFFDEELKRNNGDWKKLLQDHLFTGQEPLINGFIGGLGHPFIHLAYAWELQSPTVATEALSLGSTEYIGLHGLLDQYPPDNSTYKTISLADIIKRVHDDERFDDLFPHPGITNIDLLLQKRYGALLEHWNAWQLTDSLQQLEQCCDVSVLLGLGTGDRERKFDFYLIHTMTVAHALRVLWHFFPEEQRSCILRQFALFVIMVYICQLKPEFDVDMIESIQGVSLVDRDWETVVSKALSHKWVKDSHFLKVVRAPKAFAETYGDKENFYLKASSKFIAEFDGWEGFGLGVEGYMPNRDGYIPE